MLPDDQLPADFHGLSDIVSIEFDEWGIPRLHAACADDLFFAQGYITAEHRIAQMDLSRRRATGRMTEWFGETWLDRDYEARRLGIAAAAPMIPSLLDADTRSWFDAYVRGVNAWITENHQRFPDFYRERNLAPEPWTLTDCFAVSRLLAWGLSGALDSKMHTMELFAQVGELAAMELLTPADPILVVDEPFAPRVSVTPEEFSAKELLNPQALALLGDYLQPDSDRGAPRHTTLAGSNNWVVGPTRSATGNAFLCNDPHMPITDPPLWYEAHLVCDDPDPHRRFNVTGVTIPGLPGVVIGHNECMAWGVTNCLVDVVDIYQEKVNPADPRAYRCGDSWQPFSVRKDVFRIRRSGSHTTKLVLSSVEKEIWSSRHGPLLTTPVAGIALSMQWVGHQPSLEPRAFLRINQARSLSEFRDALRDYAVPAQNFVYADVEGNIAYQLAARVPMRSGKPWLIREGWNETHDWRGLIPFDELPHVTNPEEGFIVSANNQPITGDYPYYLSVNWDCGYRARRIRDCLVDREQLGFEEMQAIQNDNFSLDADRFKQLLLHAVEGFPESSQVSEILKEWDGRMTCDTPAPSIFIAWMRCLGCHLLSHQLDSFLMERFSERDRYITRVVDLFFNHPESLFLQGIADRQAVVASSLREALAWLADTFGPDVKGWLWGRVHTLVIPNLLDPAKSRGPFPRDGGPNCVDVASFSCRGNQFVTSGGAVMRMVVELSDPVRSENSIPGRQGPAAAEPTSGRDQLKLWREHRYRKMKF